MLGLIYLGAAALYLATMLAAVAWAWRYGRRTGASHGRAALYASGAFLLVYLPVFWNHLPVLLTLQSYCARDAISTTLVSPEAWYSQNLAAVRELNNINLDRTTSSKGLPFGGSRHEFFGGLLALELELTTSRHFGMSFVRSQSTLKDARTGQNLLTDVGYAVGPREDPRIWLLWHSCPTRSTREIAPLSKYIERLKEMNK